MSQQVLPEADVATAIRKADPWVEKSREVLADALGPIQGRHYAVRYWDGSVDTPSTASDPPFTIVIPSPSALRRMFLPPSEYSLASAYVSGAIGIEGDIVAATALGGELRHRMTFSRITRLMARVARFPTGSTIPVAHERSLGDAANQPVHSEPRDRAAIQSHYDVGNEFYAAWLDRRMVYSSAYFETGNESLDAAQTAKLDLLCNKLRLQPGDRLLDIGCGWGGLAIHAAHKYHATVLGVTLSEAQAALANERINAAGLTDRCTVELRDYRELGASEFDKVVSVGMFEHVGRQELPHYFETVGTLLRPGGLFLNRGIVEPERPRPRGIKAVIARGIWGHKNFIDRFVFPDGELRPIGEIISLAEATGFETIDLESHREHYALTLEHWVHRLKQAREVAVAATNEETYRTWLLYMAGSVHGFRNGEMGLVQLVFAKPGGC